MSENTAENRPAGGARESNLELFRILMTLGIIAHHYIVNSGIAAEGGPLFADPTAPKALFLLLCGAWGKIGINCFVLLSGWFMCRKKISAVRFLKLFGVFYFYRVVIGVIFLLARHQPVTLEWIRGTLIPVPAVYDGFADAYLYFYLFIPFMNLLIRHMTERMHLRLIGLLGILYVFYGTFRPVFSVTMNYVSWFMTVYMIASYLRLYPKKFTEGAKRWGIVSAVCVLLCSASVILLAFVSKRLGKAYFYTAVTDCNTLLAICTATALFLLFRNIRMKRSRIINTLASACFGVVCLHACNEAMREWLWHETLRIPERYATTAGALQILWAVPAVFICCALIELARMRALEKPFLAWAEKKIPGLQARWEAFEDRLMSRLR